MIEDVGEDGGVIPLPNVRSAILEKVLQYCEHHKNDAAPGSGNDDDDALDTKKRAEEVDAWDGEFIKVENNDILFEIILAANYLDIKPLLDLGCKTVAMMIKGKTPQQIREMFNVRSPLREFDPIRLKMTLPQKKRTKFARKTNGLQPSRNTCS